MYIISRSASRNHHRWESAVRFFDSTDPQTIPEDRTSRVVLGGNDSREGIRFHGARAREAQDSIQSLHAQRRFRASVATVLSTDYKAKQAVAASVPSAGAVGGVNAPVLESYDVPGAYAFVDTTAAERAALLRMEALEAQDHVCAGLSTVRSLRKLHGRMIISLPHRAPHIE